MIAVMPYAAWDAAWLTLAAWLLVGLAVVARSARPCSPADRRLVAAVTWLAALGAVAVAGGSVGIAMKLACRMVFRGH